MLVSEPEKVLCPHHLQMNKIQMFFLPSSSVLVSLPPNIVSTTEAAFLFEQNDNGPSYPKNLETKSQKQPLR